MKRYFMVTVLQPWTWASLPGQSSTTVCVDAAPGCVGCAPIFDSREAATAWRNEQGIEAADILEMVYQEPFGSAQWLP